jgi:PPOX class probable F420-dependent enzyme
VGTNQRSQITMSDDEVQAFLERSRTCTMATVGATGAPHLVAMWFSYLDGRIYFETKTKAQKAVNLKRDPHVTVMVEAGETYDQLRGVAIEGTATLIEDNTDDEYWAAAINHWERYNGPYTEEARPMVEQAMHKRVIVRVDPARVRSWDHRKLGMPGLPLTGTTAAFIGDE